MMLRRRLGGLILVLVVILLAVLLRDFVREELIGPLLYLYWFVRLFLESIPQIWVWVAFLVLAASLIGRSFAARPSPPRVRRAEVVDRGRVEEWARLLHQARGSPLARWRLAQRLGGLAADILAAEERVSQREIWRRLDRGRLDVPQPLQAYLTAQLRSLRPAGRRQARPSSLDLDPREVVQFLEGRLRQA